MDIEWGCIDNMDNNGIENRLKVLGYKAFQMGEVTVAFGRDIKVIDESNNKVESLLQYISNVCNIHINVVEARLRRGISTNFKDKHVIGYNDEVMYLICKCFTGSNPKILNVVIIEGNTIIYDKIHYIDSSCIMYSIMDENTREHIFVEKNFDTGKTREIRAEHSQLTIMDFSKELDAGMYYTVIQSVFANNKSKDKVYLLDFENSSICCEGIDWLNKNVKYRDISAHVNYKTIFNGRYIKTVRL